MANIFSSKLVRLLPLTLLLAACQPSAPDDNQQMAAPASDQHQAGEIFISPNDNRDYGVVRLDNGLTVVVVSDPDADKAAAALNVHVGSMQNPDEQLGLAHYLEHMLFLGTEKYPDPDEYGEFMARHGGMHNAYTADDHTNYMFQINNDRLDEALDRFSDFFKAPIFDPEYSQKEVNAVDSEWSMRRASDGFILFKLNNVTLNPEHPIARFRIGNNESLGDKEGSVLYEEMREFYDKYYSANLMTASIVGNYPVAELEQMARQHFADVPNHNAEVAEITVPAVTDRERSLQIFYKPQMEMRVLQIDFTIDNNREQFAAKPNELVAYMINSEMPGTPGAFLREQGWADSLGAYAQPGSYGNAGRFIIQAELTEQGLANRELIAGLLFNYLDMLRQEGIDEAYFDELDTVLNNRFTYLQRSSAFEYATQLAAALQHFPVAHVIDASYRLDEFNQDAIRALLSQLTSDNARVWFISQNEEVDQKLHFFDGEYRLDELDDQTVANWRQQAADIQVNLPSVNSLLPEDLSVQPLPDSTQAQLVVERPGVTAWLKVSERFQEPRANVAVALYQDVASWPLEQRVAADVMLEAFNVAEQALAREASVAGVGFGLGLGQGLTLNLTGFNDKQPLLAERVLTALANYQPSAERVEQIKDRLRRQWQNQARQFPVQQLGPRFSRLMNKPGENVEERLQALEAIELNQILAARDDLLQGVALRALVVGNYSGESVEALLAPVIELVELDSSLAYQRAPVVEPQAGMQITQRIDVELEDVALLDTFVLEDSSIQARAQIALLQELLHSRFFNELRTEKQLGYAVGVTQLSVADYPALAFYVQSSAADLQALMGHFESFREAQVEYLNGLTEDDFAEAKEGLLGSLREQPQNLNQEAARIRADWARENYNFDTRERLIETVERLRPEMVQNLYRRQLMDREQSMRVLLQLRGTAFADSAWVELENAIVVDDIADFQASGQGAQ